MVQAMSLDPQKAIKVARREHRCSKCGCVIKPGDRFAMGLDWKGGTLRPGPVCLQCREKGRND